MAYGLATRARGFSTQAHAPGRVTGMRGRPLKRIEGSHRYGFVLGVILVPIVFSLAAPDELWARITTAFLFAVSIFITLAVSHAKRWVQTLAFALVILVILTAILDLAIGGSGSQGA